MTSKQILQIQQNIKQLPMRVRRPSHLDAAYETAYQLARLVEHFEKPKKFPFPAAKDLEKFLRMAMQTVEKVTPLATDNW